MSSQSVSSKLKALLIIDLIFLSIVVSSYLYLQDQGLIVVGAKPATFTFSDIVIDPSEAYPGEAILVSLNATNIGEIGGNQTLNLEINDVIKDSKNITLAGGASEIVEFVYIETVAGAYSVKVGDLVGTFTIKPAPPEASNIILSDLKVDPYEVWAAEPVTLTATAQNPTAETDMLTVKIIVDDIFQEYKFIELAAGATQTVEFTINASSLEGKHTVKLNTLSGSYLVVKTGYHTLTVTRSGGGSQPLPFTLNGKELQSVYTEILPIGEYSISVPDVFDTGTGVLEFAYWNDGVTSSSRTFTLKERMLLIASYNLVSGYASCPSLYVWNGTSYVYIADISNNGWLGDISHITPEGEIVFGGANPWDYIKLPKNLSPRDGGYFDLVFTQQWDELFYFDSVYMIVVDRPVGVDTYATLSNWVNQVFNDQIYTVNMTSAIPPVAATHTWGPKGTTVGAENVLPQISQLDGIFVPGNNGLFSQSWNNISLNQLTLDLGDLSGAEQIKLILNGRVEWGDFEPYYAWIESFKAAAAQGLLVNDTELYPAPYMEIKDANGNWVEVPKGKQIPLPADYVARTFVVNLTDIFPAGTTNYQIRITNFFNVAWDYVGIDLTPQENIVVQKITGQATLNQFWDTLSNSSGAFTRYGDVTLLMQKADDMYVIGRQGDQIHLQFPTANLSAPAAGMERAYFLVTACFFKEEPGAWGYGFEWTVDPLPFIGMSGYPYPATESYPYDPAHLIYLEEYNTRVITAP